MAFYTCNRYRLIVLLLLVLIMWQFFRLLPDKSATSISEVSLLPVPGHTSGPQAATTKSFQLENHDTNPPDTGIEPSTSHSAVTLASTRPTKQSGASDESGIVELEDDKYNKHKQDKVKVRVYYEALCPDSKHFFVRHLAPVTEKLSEFLDVTLVPYGKATTKEENGKYVFQCQHGEEECYANKIHACAIEAVANMTTSVKITECMITDNLDADGALIRCAKETKIEPDSISNCARTEHGSALLKKHGDDTHILKPTFIPTITINGSRDNQAAILKNFLLEVCKLIDMPLPPPCL